MTTEEGATEVLVRWENSLPIDATWELETVIKEQFPNFHLEDKVVMRKAGNDRPRVTKVDRPRVTKVYIRKRG